MKSLGGPPTIRLGKGAAGSPEEEPGGATLPPGLSPTCQAARSCLAGSRWFRGGRTRRIPALECSLWLLGGDHPPVRSLVGPQSCALALLGPRGQAEPWLPQGARGNDTPLRRRPGKSAPTTHRGGLAGFPGALQSVPTLFLLRDPTGSAGGLGSPSLPGAGIQEARL